MSHAYTPESLCALFIVHVLRQVGNTATIYSSGRRFTVFRFEVDVSGLSPVEVKRVLDGTDRYVLLRLLGHLRLLKHCSSLETLRRRRRLLLLLLLLRLRLRLLLLLLLMQLLLMQQLLQQLLLLLLLLVSHIDRGSCRCREGSCTQQLKPHTHVCDHCCSCSLDPSSSVQSTLTHGCHCHCGDCFISSPTLCICIQMHFVQLSRCCRALVIRLIASCPSCKSQTDSDELHGDLGLAVVFGLGIRGCAWLQSHRLFLYP